MKVFLSGLIVVCSLAAINVNAEDSVPNQAAVKIINEYKALRSKCTVAKDEARKACFAELEALNSTYREAKKVISSDMSEEAVHLVSINN